MNRYPLHNISRIALATLLILGLVLYAKPVEASDATFRQQILPLNCVVQTVDNGTGTLYSIVPSTCQGLTTPPPVNNGLPPDLPYPTPSPTNTNRTLELHRVVELGLLTALAPDNQTTWTVQASVGQTFNFIINTNVPNSTAKLPTEKHKLIVENIDLSDPRAPRVIITLYSEPIQLTLYQGQKVIQDLNADGKPDVGIIANSITAAGVQLSLWQIPSVAQATVNKSPNTQHPTQYTWWYLGIGAILAVATAEILLNRYHKIFKRTRR